MSHQKKPQIHKIIFSFDAECMNWKDDRKKSKNQETSWEDVLKRADDALYRSKHDGRNLVTSYGDLAEA